MVAFYKIWKKYNDIKYKKMDLNNRKMKNNPPSPTISSIINMLKMLKLQQYKAF